MDSSKTVTIAKNLVVALVVVTGKSKRLTFDGLRPVFTDPRTLVRGAPLQSWFEWGVGYQDTSSSELV